MSTGQTVPQKTHHGHFKGVDVEGSDLPITAHVVDEFNEPM